MLAVVHPTYALFLWIPFAGFLAVRWLWDRRDVRSGGLALAALVVPAALFFAWLLPVIGDTESVSPDAAERDRAFAQYAGQLDGTPDRFVAPELFGRTGAVAVAGLPSFPWPASPRAGAGPHTSWEARSRSSRSASSPGSSRRSRTPSPCRRRAGWPGTCRSPSRSRAGSASSPRRRTRRRAARAGRASCSSLRSPATSGTRSKTAARRGRPWVAVAGAIAALVVGFRGRPPLERRAALAAALLVLPTYVHGLANWSASEARAPSPLTGGLVAAVRRDVPVGATVYADPEASYRLAAAAPIRVCVGPPGHVADTVDNRPRERVREFRRFARTEDLEIPRACGATWLLVDLDRFPRSPSTARPCSGTAWSLHRL